MASMSVFSVLFANPYLNLPPITRKFVASVASKRRALVVVAAASNYDSDPVGVGDSSQKPTRLVTFLGKGGSGKTTASVFAAQHYAMSGLNTCLVIHNQDPTADHLLECKIGTSPKLCDDNLSVLRLETTKILLEPLDRLKEADSRLNMTQGVLEGVMGEELGVLPGMDSIFSVLELERLVGFFRQASRSNSKGETFDVVIYDGISTEETLRMIGVSNKARLYLKYLRSIAEKTDLGRLAGPSIMRLVDEVMSISGNSSSVYGMTSSDIWDTLERFLERGTSVIREPSKFGCFLVMDPNNPMSIISAQRYWGCTLQAGAHVSGVIALSPPHLENEPNESVKESFLPLPFAFASVACTRTHPNWNKIVLDHANSGTRKLLSETMCHGSGATPSVKFDTTKKAVTLFMPGFEKSEIKLYQYRGGSELLVEAGDQRRVIHLPPQIQGKVGGAKFMDRSLIITMR